MRIAIDIRSISSPTPSGVGHSVSALLHALSQSKHNHELILFTTGRKRFTLPAALEQDTRMRLVQPKGPSRFWNLGIALGIVSLRQLIGEEPDVVWYPNTGFLPRTQARVVLTVHDLAFHLMPSTYTRIDHLRYRITRARRWIQRADRLIAISKTTKQDLTKALNVPSQRIAVIPHGVDTATFHSRPQPTDATQRQQLGVRTPYILFLATREPRKNLRTLVEAWEDAKDGGYAPSLIIAGGAGWKRRALDRTVATSRHKKNLHVLGYVPDHTRPALLRGAQALALPSRYEGFGMQVLEAMACGTPVITSRNSSLLEVAGNAAVTARAMSVGEWTEALSALQDPVLAAHMNGLAEQKLTKFSWRVAARALIDALAQ